MNLTILIKDDPSESNQTEIKKGKLQTHFNLSDPDFRTETWRFTE